MYRVNIGSDNGLLSIAHHDIIWTNAGLLSIGPSGTNFSEIWIKIQNFSFMKTHLKISSAKWWPFCPGGDELAQSCTIKTAWILYNFILRFIFYFMRYSTLWDIMWYWTVLYEPTAVSFWKVLLDQFFMTTRNMLFSNSFLYVKDFSKLIAL